MFKFKFKEKIDVYENTSTIQTMNEAAFFRGREASNESNTIFEYKDFKKELYRIDTYLRGFVVYPKHFVVTVTRNEMRQYRISYNLEYCEDNKKEFFFGTELKSGILIESLDFKQLSFVLKETGKKLWEVEHNNASNRYEGELLYCFGKTNPDSEEKKLYCINVKTNKKVWVSPEKFEENFRLEYKMGLFVYGNKLFLSNKRNKKLYMFDKQNGQVMKSWQFSSPPVSYNNKIGSISTFLEELDLDTMEFEKTDLRPELLKHTVEVSGLHGPVGYIADGLGFIAKFENRPSVRNQDYTLYAFDLSSQKIVWKHAFDYIRLKNFRDIKYVNGKLYFLRGDGELHIFEKQT